VTVVVNAAAIEIAVPSREIDGGAIPSSRSSGRTSSGGYYVSESDKQLFEERGYVHLPGVMAEDEMRQEIDEVDPCHPTATPMTVNALPFPALPSPALPLQHIPRWCL
jgi:hypothetical protein